MARLVAPQARRLVGNGRVGRSPAAALAAILCGHDFYAATYYSAIAFSKLMSDTVHQFCHRDLLPRIMICASTVAKAQLCCSAA